MNLANIRSDALLEDITRLLGTERDVTAKLLAYLAEVEERRLHLELGHSSMFDFSVTRCKMSEGQAHRRILAARLARRFAVIHSLTPARSRRIGRAVRRDVFERDGEQCTYISEDGQRCASRSLLELDHVRPRALGGASDAANLRVRYRAHNQLWAEHVYGREHMARQRNLRQRKYAAGPAGEREDATSDRLEVQSASACRSSSRVEHPKPVAQVLEDVRCALERLGFRPAEARQAVVAVQEVTDRESGTFTFDHLLRAALCRVRLAPSRRSHGPGAKAGK